MSMNKLIVFAAVAASAAIPMAANAASITIDSVKQRWPWNNKVDITYTVGDAQVRTNGLYYGIRFDLTANGKTYTIHGYSFGASAESGNGSRQHTATFTAPSGISCTDCSITATLFTTNVPSGNDYMIVDVRDGSVWYEGLMNTQNASNSRYNTDTYKNGGLMVLRKVPKWADRASLPNAASLPSAGYPTGDDNFTGATTPQNDGNCKAENWETARDYYIGVFPVTYYQSAVVEGWTDNGKTPRRLITWGNVRGNLAPTATIPSDGTGTGFLAKLNTLTKLKCGVSGFDLPTEPMFEIACRAGATTKYFWGGELDTSYIVCNANATENTDPGERHPNAWGLYGMSGGSVWQMCRDYFGAIGPKYMKTAFDGDPFTPVGDSYGNNNYYVRRGGGAYDGDATNMAKTGAGRYFYASYRTSARGNLSSSTQGFRVAYVAEWGK